MVPPPLLVGAVQLTVAEAGPAVALTPVGAPGTVGLVGVTAFAMFAGALDALPFGWHLPQALAAASWAHIGALLWLGIAPTFVGYLAWNLAVNRASASQVSSFIYLSPPIALLIGWLWLHEVPDALVLVGGAITIGGVVLANARRRPAPPVASAVLPVSSCEQP